MSATPRPWTILPRRLMSHYGGLRFLEPVACLAHYLQEGKEDKWEVCAENLSLEDADVVVRAVNAYAVLAEAVEYAHSCLNGTVRDYANELPEKIQAALAAIKKST